MLLPIRTTTAAPTAGLGAYPGQPYFDPNRPAWLPYWVDTPSENAQKWGLYPGADINQVYPAPPMPVPPAPPVNLPANPADGPSAQAAVDAVATARANAQRQQTQQFMDMVGNVLDQAQADRVAASEQQFSLLVVAGVVLGFVLIPRLLGR